MKAVNVVLKVLIWLAWLFMFYSIFMYRAFIEVGDEKGEWELFVITMLAGSVIFCVLVRWLAIPRIYNLFILLIVFLVGMFIGESIMFYGLFLFQGFADIFFYTSLIMMLQFVPVFLHTRSYRAVDKNPPLR